jgi:hypothetical protein
MARTSASAQALIDHDNIQQWAEERGGTPASVRGTGGGDDVGMIRLDFPGYSGQDSLQEISWDDWFRKFDESNLALLVQEQTARGQQSNFNKLVSRESVQRPGRQADRRQSGRNQSRSTGTGGGHSNQRSASATTKRGSTLRDRGTKSSRSRTQKSGASSRGRQSSTTRSRASSRASNSSGSRPKARSSSSRQSASNARSSASNVRSIGKRSAAANRSSARKRAA